jgi:hypothetical protein
MTDENDKTNSTEREGVSETVPYSRIYGTDIVSHWPIIS